MTSRHAKPPGTAAETVTRTPRRATSCDRGWARSSSRSTTRRRRSPGNPRRSARENASGDACGAGDRALAAPAGGRLGRRFAAGIDELRDLAAEGSGFGAVTEPVEVALVVA